MNHRNALDTRSLTAKTRAMRSNNVTFVANAAGPQTTNIEPLEEHSVLRLTQLPNMITLAVVVEHEHTNGDQRGRSPRRKEGVVFEEDPVAPDNELDI